MVSQGHLSEYIDNAEKAKMKEVAVNDDEQPPKRLVSREITGVINAILTFTNKGSLTKKAMSI